MRTSDRDKLNRMLIMLDELLLTVHDLKDEIDDLKEIVMYSEGEDPHYDDEYEDEEDYYEDEYDYEEEDFEEDEELIQIAKNDLKELTSKPQLKFDTGDEANYLYNPEHGDYVNIMFDSPTKYAVTAEIRTNNNDEEAEYILKKSTIVMDEDMYQPDICAAVAVYVLFGIDVPERYFE